jgi:hypothetical protein
VAKLRFISIASRLLQSFLIFPVARFDRNQSYLRLIGGLVFPRHPCLSFQLRIGGQNAQMSKSDEYRARVAECLQKAELAKNEADKRPWLTTLAEGWLLLVNFRDIAEQKLAKLETVH